MLAHRLRHTQSLLLLTKRHTHMHVQSLFLAHTHSRNHTLIHSHPHTHTLIHSHLAMHTHNAIKWKKSCTYYCSKTIIAESKLGHKNGCEHFSSEKKSITSNAFLIKAGPSKVPWRKSLSEEWVVIGGMRWPWHCWPGGGWHETTSI